MHTKTLKTLVKIAEVESFATAASQLGITLSALSMQIKALEKDLGVTLFDRSFRPPKLTPLGRRIASEAGSVISAEKTLLELCHPDNTLSGTYRMGFVATASVRLLPQFLKNASSKAPEVVFELETGLSESLEEKLLSGQLDAAVLTASGETTTGLDYRVLREEELLYAIPGAYVELPIKETARKLTFLQFNPASGIGKVIAGHISMVGTRRTRTIHLDSVEAIMECVNAGIGFTMLPAPDIERYARAKLHLVKPKGNRISRQLVLATSGRTIPESAAGILAQLFKS